MVFVEIYKWKFIVSLEKLFSGSFLLIKNRLKKLSRIFYDN